MARPDVGVNARYSTYIGNRTIQKKKNLTETVRAWREYWPEHLPLPHPSPRNNIWLKKNSWFEKEVLPELRNVVAKILQA